MLKSGDIGGRLRARCIAGGASLPSARCGARPGAGLSSASAMRALAAVVAFAACSCLHVHALSSPDRLSRALLTTLGVQDGSPVHKLLDCSRALGTARCFSALSAWRAEKALEILDTGVAAQFDLREDIERFPWQQYGNSTNEDLYSQLTEDTEKLLRYRSLRLSLPGYSLELESKGNGTLNVDVLRGDPSTQRGMKKYLKDIYSIMPILLLPGLVMSAILPFVLPMLKMLTVFAGMINNAALSGAVFTLLRNNAFNDHYEKKVIYVNEGYKNEKFSPLYFKNHHPSLQHLDIDHIDFGGSDVHPVIAPAPGQNEFPGDNFNAAAALQEEALNADWINQYYGNAEGVSANPFIGIGSTLQSIQASPFVVTSLPKTASAGPTQTKVRRSSKIKSSY